MSSSYNIFARYYDMLTQNADYEVRGDYIAGFFSDYGRQGKKLLDLACGTGSAGKYFYDRGFDVAGIDLSVEMLTQAKQKCPGAMYIRADMTSFDLAEKFDYCICCLDSINHLTSISDVEKCFKCVAGCLNTGGLFVFDVNTLYKHRRVLGSNTFVFDEDDFFLCWDNSYSGNGLVEIFLDFFIPSGDNYLRFSENFAEKAYGEPLMRKTLAKCGFEVAGVFDELTRRPPKSKSERLYFVCKRI